MKNRLMDQFVNTDSRSRPCTAEYAEGWDRIFGKKQERSDVVTREVTVRLNHVDGRVEEVKVVVDAG